MLTGDSQQAADYIASKTGIGDVGPKLLPQDKVNQMDACWRAVRSSSSATASMMRLSWPGPMSVPPWEAGRCGCRSGRCRLHAVRVSAVPAALHLSRETMKIAMENVVFALGIKAVVMIAGFAGYAFHVGCRLCRLRRGALCVLNSVRMLCKK